MEPEVGRPAIVVRSYAMSTDKTLLTIAKVTKDHFVTSDGTKWRRLNGRMVGDRDSYTFTTCRPCAEDEANELVAEHARLRLARRLENSVVWSSLTIEQLRAIKRIVEGA